TVVHPALLLLSSFFFFFNATATTVIYTLSLHDALPISFSGSLEGADEMGFELLGTSSPEDCASGPGATARAALVLVTGEEDSLRSEEHTSELQSQSNLVCRLLLEKKKK